MIASPEVELNDDHVKKMSDVLTKNPKMLVIGYALEAELDDPEKWMKGHDIENKSDAYKVPWNTCAMWNADLFLKYVGDFHIICDCSEFLGFKEGIKLRGMEDALAIALAQQKNFKIKAGLIKNPLPWDVNIQKSKDHIEKMKRKGLVYEKYKTIFGIFNPLNIEYF